MCRCCGAGGGSGGVGVGRYKGRKVVVEEEGSGNVKVMGKMYGKENMMLVVKNSGMGEESSGGKEVRDMEMVLFTGIVMAVGVVVGLTHFKNLHAILYINNQSIQ